MAAQHDLTAMIARAAGLVTLEDAADVIRRRGSRLVIEAGPADALPRAMEALAPLLRLAGGLVELKPVEQATPPGLPRPTLRLQGRLGGRLRLHGLPGGFLLHGLAYAAALAAGALEPGCSPGIARATGRALVYLVEGLPCLRALEAAAAVVACSPAAELDAVKAEGLPAEAQPPAAPYWVTPRGRYLGAPRSPEEAAALWG